MRHQPAIGRMLLVAIGGEKLGLSLALINCDYSAAISAMRRMGATRRLCNLPS
jgi:hypothetical protein